MFCTKLVLLGLGIGLVDINQGAWGYDILGGDVPGGQGEKFKSWKMTKEPEENENDTNVIFDFR